MFCVPLAGPRPQDVNHASCEMKLGALYGYQDPRLGPQIYRYVQVIQSGGMAAGELAKRAADVAVSATGGSVRSIQDTAAPFTADDHYGDLIVITDDAGGAEAAPEGDVRTLGDSSTTVAWLDRHEADFSAAPAASDTGLVKRFYKAIDSVDGDAKDEVLGIFRGAITEDYYGLALVWGMCDFAKVKAGITVDNAIVSDAVMVGDVASDELKLQIGSCYATAFAGGNGTGGLIFVDLLNCIGLEEA